MAAYLQRSTAPLRRVIALACVLLASTALAAEGMSLADAKADGLVGETSGGYVAIVDGGGDASLRALVEDVNTRRRAEYERIAASNGIALADVEKLAAEKAIARTRAGHMIRVDGNWQPK